MTKFRLYIDESGTHNYSQSEDLKSRYLGLTGIFVDFESNEKVLQPRLLKLKKMLSDDPDYLPIFHREDIVAKRGHFKKLNDPLVEIEFNKELISLIRDLKFTICAIVLDKKSHLNVYQQSALHPYHYCLTVLLERYTHFLETRGRGDVLAESRGEKEDNSLKEVYQDFYTQGTHFRSPTYVQKFLTSREIKIRKKTDFTGGLEFADLLELATKLDVLHTFGVLKSLNDNFAKIIINSIQDKYYKGGFYNKIDGYGKKLIGQK